MGDRESSFDFRGSFFASRAAPLADKDQECLRRSHNGINFQVFVSRVRVVPLGSPKHGGDPEGLVKNVHTAKPNLSPKCRQAR